MKPLRLLLCPGLFGEARTALGPLPGLELTCQARRCHLPAQEQQALVAEADRQDAHLVGGSCLTGLGPDPLASCFRFFLPPERIEELLAGGGYLVTAGWLADWRGAMAEWGLDRDQSRELFRDSCRAVLLLDSGLDARAMGHLNDFAAFVDRPAERIPADPVHLRAALLEEAWTAREQQLAGQAAAQATSLAHTRRRLAEHAALVDLVQRLATSLDEGAIVQDLLTVAQSLFAARLMIWIPHWKGHWGEPVGGDPGAGRETLVKELLACPAGVHPSANGDGLLLRLEGQDGPLGLLGLAELACPDQLPAYLETAGTLARAAQLALGNAHNLHGWLRICAWCHQVEDPDGGWVTFEKYVHRVSTAHFSHGLCPGCAERMVSEASQL